MRLFLVIFIFIILINLTSSKTETSPDWTPSPPRADDSLKEDAQEDPISPSEPHPQISMVTQGSSHRDSSSAYSRALKSQTVTATEIMPFEKEYLIIKKEVIPKTKSGYIRPGDFAQVRVEIYSNANSEIQLNLTEIADERLSVFYPSVHGYILNNTSSICYYEEKLYEKIESGLIEANSSEISASSPPIINWKDNLFLFNLSDISNGSLSHSLNKSPNFKKFLIYKLGAIDGSDIDQFEIRKGDHNITVFQYYNFSWDRIPGKDDEKLKAYLVRKFGNGWIKTARIEKIGNGKTIMVVGEKNYILLKLNNNESKTDDGRVDKFIPKNENGDLNIYSESIFPIITINNSSDLIDKGYINLYYKNLVFHLKQKNGSIYDMNNILAFESLKLFPADFFVFWYCIKAPLDSGSFAVKTYATIDDLKPRQIVLSSAAAIVDNSPSFSATRTFSNYQNFLNDEFEIEFDIEYEGGGTEPKIDNIEIRFDVSNEYEYVSIDGKICNDDLKRQPKIIKSFIINESVPIKLKIKFKKEGKITPPSLWINYDRKQFSEYVEVDRPAGRYFSYIYLFITAISFLFFFSVKELYLDIRHNKETLSDDILEWIKELTLMDTIKYVFIFIIIFIIMLAIMSWILNLIIPFLIRITSI